MMPILELNADVLHELLTWFGKRTLVTFMSTCNIAYEVGLYHLVTSVNLQHSMRQAFQFSQFMLLEKHRHKTLNMLRSFHLSGGASAVGILEATASTGIATGLENLATLLKQARNLTALRIVDVALLCQLYPRICEAITQNLHLASIFFTAADNPNSLALDMIPRMPTLRHIHVSHGSDLIPIIRPFQHTLETLSSEYRFFRNPNDFLSLSDEDVWPRVHSLNLGLLTMKTHRLVRAFPNLRRLRLQSVMKSPLADTVAYDCWPSLDYVEVNIAGLQELGLTCPIREMYLNTPPDMKFWQHDNWLTTFLKSVRTALPSALSFPAMANVRDDALFSQLALQLPNLKVLGLSFVYDPVATLVRLVRVCILGIHHASFLNVSIQELVFKLLENVPIGYLTLELSRPTPIMHSPAEILMFLAPTLSIPTVQVVELQLRGSPRNPVFGVKSPGRCSWWKVTRTSVDRPQFEEISRDLGLRFRELYVMGEL
jgi:hypothetical protein